MQDAAYKAGAHLQPWDCGGHAGIRGPTLRLSTAQTCRSPSPSRAAPGSRRPAHTPPRSGSELTYRLRLPGPAPAAARRDGPESCGRRVARRPRQPRPAPQPPALPGGGGAGGSASGPSQRPGTRADRGLRPLAGKPGRSLPPCSICALASTSSLPSNLPLSSLSALLYHPSSRKPSLLRSPNPIPDLFPPPFTRMQITLLEKHGVTPAS